MMVPLISDNGAKQGGENYNQNLTKIMQEHQELNVKLINTIIIQQCNFNKHDSEP